jgi:hypothetical protein
VVENAPGAHELGLVRNGVAPGCPRSDRSTCLMFRSTLPAEELTVRGWLGMVVSSA